MRLTEGNVLNFFSNSLWGLGVSVCQWQTRREPTEPGKIAGGNRSDPTESADETRRDNAPRS